MSVIDRFMQKVTPEPSTGCWLWTGAVDQSGYARLSIGRKNKTAHRISYRLFIGDIPEGLLVCHKCDVRSCVNPNHLFLGTDSDNMKDMALKGRGWNPRGAMTVCINGHPLSGENLKIKADGARRCLTCLKEFERKRSQKRRSK